MLAIQKAIHQDNVIGEIRGLYSDFSMDIYGKKPDTNRVLSAELAGGPLLDVGPYPLVWVGLRHRYPQTSLRWCLDSKALMILYRHPKNQMTPPDKVGSTMLLAHTGVDMATSFALTFPKINSMAYCMSSQTVHAYIPWDHLRLDELVFAYRRNPEHSYTGQRRVGAQINPHVRCIGPELKLISSEIIVQGSSACPKKYIIRRMIDPSKGDGKFLPDKVIDMSFEGFGLFWQADAVARCLKGRLAGHCGKKQR